MRRYCFFCGKVIIINEDMNFSGLKYKVYCSDECRLENMKEVACLRIQRNY